MYNTGNPVPSADFRDLSDNAEVLDRLLNGADPSYAGRLGALLKSWAAIEVLADTLETALANNANPLEGSAKIGHEGSTVRAALLALASTASPTFAALTLTNGQLVFPATQVPSANANTLDDYQELPWTPVLTFATPGNLAVTYATQVGSFTKIGRLCVATFDVITSAFTHTTASGALQITGLPEAAAATVGLHHFGGVDYAGYTDATRPHVTPRVTNGTQLVSFIASGSGVSDNAVSAAQMPSGGTVTLRGTVIYHT